MRPTPLSAILTLTLAAAAPAMATSLKDVAPYPEAEKGYTRQVIHLPAQADGSEASGNEMPLASSGACCACRSRRRGVPRTAPMAIRRAAMPRRLHAAALTTALTALALLAPSAQAQEMTRHFGSGSQRPLKVRSTTDIAIFAPVIEAFLSRNPDIAIDYEQWGSNALFDLSLAECKAALSGQAQTGSEDQADVVISTALIPGRPAPVLVTEAMVQSMKPGSVIVDLAAGRGPGGMGGNCPLTETDQTVVKHGVTLVGETNLAAMVGADASALYARNVLDFLKLVLPKDATAVQVPMDDDIVAACLMTQGGEVKRK